MAFMASQGCDCTSRRGIPNSCSMVGPGGCQTSSIRRICRRVDVALVAFQNDHQIAGRGLPYLRRVILAGSDQMSAIWRVRDLMDRVRVTPQSNERAVIGGRDGP